MSFRNKPTADKWCDNCIQLHTDLDSAADIVSRTLFPMRKLSDIEISQVGRASCRQLTIFVIWWPELYRDRNDFDNRLSFSKD